MATSEMKSEEVGREMLKVRGGRYDGGSGPISCRGYLAGRRGLTNHPGLNISQKLFLDARGLSSTVHRYVVAVGAECVGRCQPRCQGRKAVYIQFGAARGPPVSRSQTLSNEIRVRNGCNDQHGTLQPARPRRFKCGLQANVNLNLM